MIDFCYIFFLILLTGDKIETNVGTLKAGETFGEISLLHRVPRTLTITSKSKGNYQLLKFFNNNKKCINFKNILKIKFCD